MGKNFFLTAVIVFFAACTGAERNGLVAVAGTAVAGTDAVSSATVRKGPPARVLLGNIMPEAAADGVVKIAVVVNLKEGDQSRQFIEGCVWEGRSMGFTVDTFVTGGAEAGTAEAGTAEAGTDEQRCGELIARIARADYDGLVFSNADDVFSYDALKPAADNGMPIVTFEALPVKAGRTLSGITATFLDDYGLARLSLDTLLSYTGDRLTVGQPARVIRIGTEAGVSFMVRRTKVFYDYLDGGKIEETAVVNLRDLENPAVAAREGLAAVLSRFPPGSVDAVWSPYDECAAGCAEALITAGRWDLKLVSIGISDNDIRLMQKYSVVWLASSAVDPRLAGAVNMRILAAKLAGETLSDGTFSFGPKLVKTADLNRDVNMANIGAMVPDWGDGGGLFDYYPWMKDLKSAEGKYLRIPPPAEAPSAIPPAEPTAVTQ
jgi:simple sugar transport system substrate-binding protein